MSVTAKKIIPGSQLTNAAATYYTAPANTTTQIRKLTFVNNDSSAHTVTVYLVPSGGTAGVTNLLVKAAAIAAGATFEAFEAEGHILQTGDFIQALADAGSQVTIQGSGVEIV